jgi:hypothetical protein
MATGGAEIATAKQYGFHLHAKPYVGYSGSSDFIRFEAVISRLVVYSEFLFSALVQNFFDWFTDTVNPQIWVLCVNNFHSTLGGGVANRPSVAN